MTKAKKKKKSGGQTSKSKKLKLMGGDGGPFPRSGLASTRLQREDADGGADPLVKLVLAFVDARPTVKKVAIAKLPPAVSAAFLSWAQSLNLPLDDGSTESSYFAVTGTGQPGTFIASYSGDDPDPFLATAVAQGGSIVGTSVEVQS